MQCRKGSSNIPLCKYHSRSFNPPFDKNLPEANQPPYDVRVEALTQTRIERASG